MNNDESSAEMLRALRESEAKWRRLAETAPDMILSVDCEGRITSINRALPGYRIEDAIGRSADEFIPAGHRTTLMEAIQKACRGQTVDYEIAGAGSHGKIAWYMGRVGPIEVNGQLIGATIMARDITERKEMEDALRQAHDELEVKVHERTSELSKTLSLLQATLESSTDGILVVNGLGQMTTLNQNFVHLWSIPEELTKQLTMNSYLEYAATQVQDPAEFRRKIKKLESSSELESHDIVELKDNRIYEIYSRPQIIAGFVMGRVWSFRDVTLRNLAEREKESLLAREREARIEAEKSIALRDDFISIASHELRTPLTPLKMQVNLIDRQLQSGVLSTHPKAKEFTRLLKSTEDQVDHLTRLIEGILDVSRITAGRLILYRQKINLSKLIESVVSRYSSALIKAKCSIQLNLDPEVEVNADPLRMDQVIVNLLTNAMKYGAGKLITISTLKIMGCVELRVQDLGIGIHKKDHFRIFERFERVAPIQHYPGMGLGLFITHQIIRAHGGSIHVESYPGEGATFIVRFSSP